MPNDPSLDHLCAELVNTCSSHHADAATSTQDVDLSHKSGAAKLATIRSLILDGHSGQVTVESVGTISKFTNNSGAVRIGMAGDVGDISHVSGSMSLNANSVRSISQVSGSMCVRANTIGSVTSSSGMKTLIANSIEQVTVSSGTMHIYGATVNMISNSSGKVCLHDGARVLNQSHNSGTIGTCH
jgi:hypothetical protein